MKDKDLLRIEQLEGTVKPFRKLIDAPVPRGGWVRALREALGMTNVQLARRLKKVPQSIEDMQKSEVTGTIQLQTLRMLAEALGCRLVYAVVPPKPLPKMIQDRACAVARRRLHPVSHSMKLEEQGVSPKEEERQLELLIQRLLAGNPKQLWE